MGVTAALAILAGLSWLYLAHWESRMAGGVMMNGKAMGGDAMSGHLAMGHAGGTEIGMGEFALAAVMWSVMMVAMMLPTALPAIAVFGDLAQRRAARPALAAPPLAAAGMDSKQAADTTLLFAAGYVGAWIGYALAAAAAQLALARAALLAPQLQSTSAGLSAAILVAAGLFQFTPLKDQCLAKCRHPLAFFLAEWRDGKAGALRLGLHHGSYCVACCWALMAIMLVVGAMNLAWMAALTLLVLGEKLAPARWKLSRAAGLVLVLWGLAVAASLIPLS